jgi:hypothetical protein
MRNVIRSPSEPEAREIVAILVRTGYLQPAAVNNADAITNAISQMKHDLRDRRGRDDGRWSAGASITSDVGPFPPTPIETAARKIALSALSATALQD